MPDELRMIEHKKTKITHSQWGLLVGERMLSGKGPSHIGTQYPKGATVPEWGYSAVAMHSDQDTCLLLNSFIVC